MNRKEEIKKMIYEVVKKHLGELNFTLFIFGSQSNFPQLKLADIDVGIEAQRPLSNLEESAIWNDLNELPSLYEFDFVDFKKTGNDFRKIAMQNIELI